MKGRTYDLLVIGATGFTGHLACEYLTAWGPPGLKWAAVGRSEAKLANLRGELGLSHTLQCDVTDLPRLEQLIRDASVVANFAGSPFIDKALPIVRLCAEHGTDYVDITGETPLQRASYDLYHEQAISSGACIVHQCGYDSIPSDIGAFLAVGALRDSFGCTAAEIKTFVGKSKGGISGGTLATVLYMLTKADVPGAADAAARGAYALDPAGAKGGPDTAVGSPDLVRYDRRMRTWHAPFVMAAVNAPVVRKSAVLLGYGDDCRYAEVMAVPSLLAAVGAVAGLALSGAALLLPPVRALLFKLGVLPRCHTHTDRIPHPVPYVAISTPSLSPFTPHTAHSTPPHPTNPELYPT